MRRIEVEGRALRDDPSGVDLQVAAVVVILNVEEVDSALDLRQLVDFLDIVLQVGIVSKSLHERGGNDVRNVASQQKEKRGGKGG